MVEGPPRGGPPFLALLGADPLPPRTNRLQPAVRRPPTSVGHGLIRDDSSLFRRDIATSPRLRAFAATAFCRRRPLIHARRIAVALVSCHVAAQEIPGSYARSDSKGLRAALAKIPGQPRPAAPPRPGAHARGPEGPLDQDRGDRVDDQEGPRSDPDALVPLRWLVRDAYLSKKWDDAIQYGQRILKLDPTDIDVATLVVKAMIRDRPRSRRRRNACSTGSGPATCRRPARRRASSPPSC